MSVFLVPVGHDLGPRLVGAGQESGQESGQYEFLVRVGTHVRHLDSLSFAIWLLAHDSQSGLPERTTMIEATLRLGLDAEQAGAALTELLADGLLAEIEPGSERGFAERHQLLPLMVGLGPDSKDPGLRTVGLLDIPVVQVSEPLFHLWLWAHLRPSLWQACVEAAGSHPEQEGVPPDRVLSEVLTALHPLLASRAAYLDVREAA